jgi:hypothetical protein
MRKPHLLYVGSRAAGRAGAARGAFNCKIKPIARREAPAHGNALTARLARMHTCSTQKGTLARACGIVATSAVRAWRRAENSQNASGIFSDTDVQSCVANIPFVMRLVYSRLSSGI